MLSSLIFCFACFAFADAFDDCSTGNLQSPIDLPSLTTLEERHYAIEIDLVDPQSVMWEEFDGSMGWLLAGNIQRIIPRSIENTFEGPIWIMQYMTVVEKSEHTIEGKRYDAELQIVFKDLQRRHETVRMSVLLESGQDHELDSFWLPLMQTLNPRSHNRYRSLDLKDLFSKLDLHKYYRYHGSETSRGCLENVYWIVMGSVLKVNPVFLHFLKLKGASPRETQDRNGRKIEVGELDQLSFPESGVRGTAGIWFDPSEISVAAKKKRNKRKKKGKKKRKNKNKGESVAENPAEIPEDAKACEEATMEDGTCCMWANSRFDYSDLENVPDHPEECCEGEVTMNNECPVVCEEATMADGTCCAWANSRFDYSDLENVPDHPEECCEGEVTMNNECPAPVVCTEATMKDGSCCMWANSRWDWSDPSNPPDHPEECCKGEVTMDNKCPAPESSSSMVYEAVGSMGTQQVVKLFAFIGAASIMFHGAKVVYKGICTSNEEFQKVTDNAEC